ncbi:CheR family methyltransferase [Hyalangium gracile]|uniref:CheR family methyltransferase n=1 Tax=Hyalangium gracile TaxID=394092 RepID=UPI001CCC79A4|nr:protein-glutamate O-methyltransferase CheR [Hyalangium gracile]
MSSGPLPWSDIGYARVFERVQERAGLLPPTCVPAAEEGIARAMARARDSDFSSYLERITSDAAALDDLITELTIGETYFFRTHEHFDFLSRQALPELRRLRPPEHTLRVWSAGCASGEEPYSLAVLLMEEGFGDRMEVLATDISRAALARAQEASFGLWSFRGTRADRMRPFLRQEGPRYVLAPEVRQRVRFDYLNLALDTWPSPGSGIHDLDVIFCRNVLIYFTRATIEAVARRLHASLADQGFLVTGPSDPSLIGLAPFEPFLTEWGVAYRRLPAEAPRVLPPSRTRSQTSLPVIPPLPPPAPAPRAAPPAPAPRPPPAAPMAPKPSEALEPARQALVRGDWREAAQLAGAQKDSPESSVMAIRALANVDAEAAVRACAEAAARHPMAVELRYLEALLLLGLGRLGEAERAARQALYLEPSLAVAHLTLGHVLRRLGDISGAVRAFRTAEALCATLPPEAAVPLSEGERAGRLAELARGEQRRLEAIESREKS